MLYLPNTLFKTIVLRSQNKTKPQNNSKNHQALPSPLKRHREAGKQHNYTDSFSPLNSSEQHKADAESKSSWIQNPASCVPEWPSTQLTALTSALHSFQTTVTLIKVPCCQSLHPCYWQHYSFPEKQQSFSFNQKMHFVFLYEVQNFFLRTTFSETDSGIESFSQAFSQALILPT